MSKSSFFISFLLLFSFWASAQEIYFSNLNANLNPPSEECYNVMQDQEGYIWVATEKGLMKIAGNTTQIYHNQPSSPEGAIYAMRPMSHGRNLFISARYEVMYSRRDGLEIDKKQSAFARSSEMSGKISPSLIYQIQELGEQDYLFSNQIFTYRYDLASQSGSRVQLKETEFPDANFLINLGGTHPHYIKNPFSENFELDRLKNKKQGIVLQYGAARKKIDIEFTETEQYHWRNLSACTKDLFFFSIHNKLLVVQKDLTYRILEFPKRIISLYTDSRGGLWIGLATGGGVHFPQPSVHMDGKESQRLLDDLSVSGFCEDQEGNLWTTTLERGIFFAASPHILYFPRTPLSDRRSYFLRRIGPHVYTTSRLDELFSLQGSQLEQISISEKQNFEIADVAQFGKYFFVATRAYLYQLEKSGATYRPITIHPNSVYEFASDGKKLFAMSRGWISEVGDHFFRKISPIPMKAQSMILLDSSAIYVGGNKGVYRVNPRDSSLVKLDGGDVSVSRMLLCQDKSIYASTYGQGLCRIVDQSIIPVSDSTIPMELNDLAEDSHGDLWLASNKGLIYFNRKTGRHYLLNKSNGLKADYVNKVETGERYLYVSTSAGLCLLPMEETLYNMTSPQLRLRSFFINGQPSDKTTRLNLPYSSQDLSWTFDLLSFKRGGAEGILYRLSPYDTGFTFSRDSIISYKRLPPGQYSLSVYAVNNNSLRSSKPQNYTFQIATPFWKTTGFIVGCILATAVILYSIVWFIIRRIKRKEKEKTQWNKLIADSKLSALQSQMNPHFIFNSINSIQNYILNKNAGEAYAYLSKFSKLIRKVLIQSREKAISLENELETLRLYIELERLRFDEAFDFSIHLSQDINTHEIMIPTMIIQPYVENAIWHGLMNLKGTRRGKLSLSFSTDEDFLIIIIDDNGVGRMQAAKLKQQNLHKPEGLNITSERIELINRMNHRKENAVQIFDKRDADGFSLGTRVEITINTRQYDES